MYRFWQKPPPSRDDLLKQRAQSLYEAVADEDIVLSEQPITAQIQLQPLIGRDVSDAADVMACFLKCQDVNVANHHGLTLLHHLILNHRLDLVPALLAHPQFTKINFKACYQIQERTVYASAFDMALMQWFRGEGEVRLEMLVLMLLYGAQPPDPLASFYDGTLITYLYPALILKRTSACQPQEVVTLLAILHAYGFALDQMEQDFRDRLWGARAGAEQFAEVYQVSVIEQRERFDETMAVVRRTLKQGAPKGEVLVPLDAERLDTGEFVLRLPFKTVGRPCLLM